MNEDWRTELSRLLKQYAVLSPVLLVILDKLIAMLVQDLMRLGPGCFGFWIF